MSWAHTFEVMLQGKRDLADQEVSFEDCILSFPKMAALDWCAKCIEDL